MNGQASPGEGTPVLFRHGACRPGGACEAVRRVVVYLLAAICGYIFASVVVLPLVLYLKVDPTDIVDLRAHLGINAAFYTVSSVVILFMTLGLVVMVDREPAEALGLGRRGSWSAELWFGASLGLAATGSIFAVCLAAGWVRITGSLLSQSLPVALRTVALAFVLMAAVALAEEVMVRGYVLRVLSRGCGPAFALISSSLFFGLLHLANPGAGTAGVLGTTAAGLVLGYAYLTTRRLWLPMGFHFGWNFCLGPVFGFPVSGLDLAGLVELRTPGMPLWTGGAFGPEAGVLSVIALGLVAIAVKWFGATRLRDKDHGTGYAVTW